MFSKLEFAIAFRYLKSKRKEGFISITAIFSLVGITIGVATLIIVMSVMNGFRYELVNRILGINSHLTIQKPESAINDYENLVEKIKNSPLVKFSNPIIEAQAMISANNKNGGAVIKGIKLNDLKNKKLIVENIIAGSVEAINQRNKVIIGSNIALQMNLKIDDEIKIISANTAQTIMGAIPRIKSYKVGGIFQSGLYEYDSSTIFSNFEMAKIHFNFNDTVSTIEIFGNNPENLEELKLAINQIINSGNLKTLDQFYIFDWQESNSGFIDALKVESTVMFLILTLIILVAAFNIISTMIMLVNDKNKNIALLRTMGMSPNNIMKIFLICGSTIGFIGTFLGSIIGISFAYNINNIKLWLESFTKSELFNPAIYFLSTLPSKILISDLVIIITMSLLISFLATISPAYKASKSNPAELLRYE